MCVAALGMVVSMASSIAGFAAQSQAWSQNYVNALAAGRDQMSQNQLRQLQEQKAYGQKQHLSLIEEATKVADAEVSAADAGVSGISVDYLVADIQRKGAYNRMINTENWKMKAAQLQTEANAIPNKEVSQINSVAKPSALSLGVSLLGAGVKYMEAA